MNIVYLWQRFILKRFSKSITGIGTDNRAYAGGEGRIIPAFPGAGGSFQDGILKAALTPYIIQPTTFAEINGYRTKRLDKLSKIFKKSQIPYQIVKNMQGWLLCLKVILVMCLCIGIL